MTKSISKSSRKNVDAKTDNRDQQSRPKSKLSRKSLPGANDDKEILRLEYEQLNQWARHGEEAAHRIFNFYVSLLTAMLGGFILITQIVAGSLQTMLLIGSAVCGLLVVIGVTFLDALMSQYSRNILYRIGIEKIRAYFRRVSGIAVVLSRLPIATLESDSETLFYTLAEGRLAARQARTRPWLRRLLVLPFPVSTQRPLSEAKQKMLDA